MSAVMPALARADAGAVRVSVAHGTKAENIPIQRFLLGRIAPGWKVIQPLVVSIERGEDGSYIASDEIFYMYGEGADLHEAMEDYIAALTEYHGILSSHEDEPTTGLFKFLQTYVQPISG